ncbi:hypothetical protein BDV25DRAFT_169602 [Aspergillus avenaceus]|uniref:Uncharacterized protein n=1 Tax=Aspergillus avenaceus TaxID=36643 RepID=A0A5N6TK96_ASPAV|nr:hypothetical protein BDV25DRAFT_169602 [Aspergillus avenaceus]
MHNTSFAIAIYQWILLDYDDMAKLNSFYEEYESFWNVVPKMSTMSTSTYSSTGFTSHHDHQSLFPPKLTPTRRLDIQTYTQRPTQETYRLAVRDGHQYTPSYNTYYGARNSQTAILEFENHDETDDLLQPDFETCPRGPARTTRKKLFGANGWLGVTAEVEEVSHEKQITKKIHGLGKKIKQQVGELAEDIAKAAPQAFVHELRREKAPAASTVHISLDPPTQAKLYSELEVMICVSANAFLLEQYKDGRLSSASIAKVSSFWETKNRPQVTEFQFDQATQRRLIFSNKRKLGFHGESSTNPVRLNSNLRNWEAIAKEMNVRTFCAPDSAIRKHLHDVHRLLEMLGAPLVTLMVLQNLEMRTVSMMKDRLEKNYRVDGRDSTSSIGSPQGS